MPYLVSVFLLFLSNLAWAADTANLGGMNHNELFRMIFGLAIVVLVILFLSWLAKRMNGVSFTSGKGFQYMGGMVLGPKEKIVLLKAGNRHLLVGVGAASISMLYDFGEELPPGFVADNKSTFADALKSAIGKKK